MKLGIIKEGKTPHDFRTPMTPDQCAQAKALYPIEIVVESSPIRCFSDEEYKAAGIPVVEDVSDCDVLAGIKEVPIASLVAGKKYLFFSHTLKKQPYNQKLLWAILDKNIKLLDYEAFRNREGERLIAFGKFAGMVGAHNAIWTLLARNGSASMPRMIEFKNYKAAQQFYTTLQLPPVRIVLTGTGNVAGGAAEVFLDMGIRQVTPEEFLTTQYSEVVFTQLDSYHYVKHKDGHPFEKKEFYKNPEDFRSNFEPFWKSSDIMLNGIYWDSRSPRFFTLEDMTNPAFRLKIIADVTCDIAPDSSIPSTIRPSTIADPVYGFDPLTRKETPPFQPNCLDVMAIDNLPNEMPRDASTFFGRKFVDLILPEFFKPKSHIIERATVTKDGQLGKHFRHLQDYAGHALEGSYA